MQSVAWRSCVHTHVCPTWKESLSLLGLSLMSSMGVLLIITSVIPWLGTNTGLQGLSKRDGKKKEFLKSSRIGAFIQRANVNGDDFHFHLQDFLKWLCICLAARKRASERASAAPRRAPRRQPYSLHIALQICKSRAVACTRWPCLNTARRARALDSRKTVIVRGSLCWGRVAVFSLGWNSMHLVPSKQIQKLSILDESGEFVYPCSVHSASGSIAVVETQTSYSKQTVLLLRRDAEWPSHALYFKPVA